MTMRCDILTVFPEIIEAYLSVGVIGRAATSGLVEVHAHDLRKWAINRYGQVDDEPYGGGPGMVLLAPAVVPAVQALASSRPGTPHVILPDARGRRLDDAVARELATHEWLLFVCGRYEGFDERVHEILAADEISLGDFVLSGGELPALTILDATLRHVPGVVGEWESVIGDSFTSGLLDYPVYTRPRVYAGREVPEPLTSGNHKAISDWRLEQSVRLTLRRRPDLVLANWERLPAETRREIERIARAEGIPWPPRPIPGDSSPTR
jgi:tRNA (guanine37-N1)-methyltransferase